MTCETSIMSVSCRYSSCSPLRIRILLEDKCDKLERGDSVDVGTTKFSDGGGAFEQSFDRWKLCAQTRARTLCPIRENEGEHCAAIKHLSSTLLSNARWLAVDVSSNSGSPVPANADCQARGPCRTIHFDRDLHALREPT